MSHFFYLQPFFKLPKVLCTAALLAGVSLGTVALPVRAQSRARMAVAAPAVINEVPFPAPPSPVPYIARAQHIPLGLAPIGAKAYLLMDVDSGRILIEHNANARMFPASTTKTMTALVAIEDGDLDALVGIGPNPPKTGEQSINLLEREKFALGDLVRAAMIKSANDSCVAIAEGVAGSVPAFVKLMNAKAREIGALHTHFVNPHGLHDPNHYTTAHDLALIARAALKHPEFNQIVRTPQTGIHGNWKLGPVRPLINRNRLMLRWNACDGVKTGYTRQAGNCLIATATQIDASGKPWRLLAVAMHSKDTWNDCYNLLQKQGFDRFQPQTVAGAGEIVGAIHAQDGASEGEAIVAREVRVPVKIGEQSTLKRRVHLANVTAPVRAGQVVGGLEIDAAGLRVLNVPLVAKDAIPLSAFARVLPGAAPILPADPLRRLFGYSLLAGAVTLLVCAFKVQGRTARAQRPRRSKLPGDAPAAVDDESLIPSPTSATDRVTEASSRISAVAAPRTTRTYPNSYETSQSLSSSRPETSRRSPATHVAPTRRAGSDGTSSSVAPRNHASRSSPASPRSSDKAQANAARSSSTRSVEPRGDTARATQSRSATQSQGANESWSGATDQQTGRPHTGTGPRRSQSR